jgi:NADH:ubiquinone oxidoreductase subunit 6 (subunit J)
MIKELLHNLVGPWQPYVHFLLFAVMTLASAIAVVTLRNIVHCALFLCLAFIGVAGLFLLCNAEFLFAVQILIYVGAVTILLVFGILLSQREQGRQIVLNNRQTPWNILFITALTATILYVFRGTGYDWKVTPLSLEGTGVDPVVTEFISNTEAVGLSLMTTCTLIFEVMSMVLLVAMIGALIVAQKD